MSALNLAGFKKIKEDKNSATMMHGNGHKLIIAKSALAPLHRKALERLPLCAGGAVKLASGGDPVQDVVDSATNDVTQPDPNVAAQAAAYNQGRPGVAEAASDPAQQQADTAMSDTFHSAPPADIPGAGQPVIDQSNAPNANVPVGMTAQGALNQELAGSNALAKAQSDLAKNNAQIEQQQQAAVQAAESAWHNRSQAMQDDIKSALQDVKNGHIDPKHYQESMGTGQKVATAIGLLLGGFSTPFTHQGNPALEFLNKQIDRDVQSQKDNQDNKKNVYNAYLDQYKNAQVADQMTRATQLGIYASKIREAAAKSGSPEALAQGQIRAGQLQQQIIPLINKANLLRTNDQVQKTGQPSPIDPAKLVTSTGAPQVDQDKIFEEVKDRKNIAMIQPEILAAFDRASSRNPNESAQGKKQFESLINTTVKEKEGSARQAAFESIHNTMTPSGLFALPGEDASKRQSVVNYLKSASSAPVSDGYGLNLDNYKSTARGTPAPAPPKFTVGQDLIIKGKPAQIIDNKGNYVFKKAG